MKKLLGISLAVIIVCASFFMGASIENKTTINRFNHPHGSADHLSGNTTTVIVSVFVNDLNSLWNLDASDKKMKIVNDLGIATNWLSDSVVEYGCNASFVYDFSQNPDLYYEWNSRENITYHSYNNKREFVGQQSHSEGEQAVTEYIANNIDSMGLLKKYNADNIVYFFFSNAKGTTCARSNGETYSCDYEAVYFPVYNEIGQEQSPAKYAHEILHNFGAPDLYYEEGITSESVVTAEYKKYLEDTKSNDIMRIDFDAYTYQYHYDDISNELGLVTAYYLGISFKPDDVVKWNLKENYYNK